MIINGKNYQLEAKFTVWQLLEYLNFNFNLVVLDYNGSILPREIWKKTLLNDKDRIEVLTVTGGG